MHYQKHIKFLDFFCEIWVLTPSFFGMPLRSHYSICSPQIMQENWHIYYSMKRRKYLCDKLGVQIFPTFCGQYRIASLVKKTEY